MEEDLCGGFSRRRGGKRSIPGRGSSLSKDAKAEMCSKHWGGWKKTRLVYDGQEGEMHEKVLGREAGPRSHENVQAKAKS